MVIRGGWSGINKNQVYGPRPRGVKVGIEGPLAGPPSAAGRRHVRSTRNGPQRRTIGSRPHAQRAAAGAGRGRHRQDAGGDLPHCRVDPPPHAAGPHPGRHLHQQGGRRNAASRRRFVGQAAGAETGNLDLPFALRADPPPPHHPPRLPGHLRHLRPRRPGGGRPRGAAGDPQRRGAAAARRLALFHRPLEDGRWVPSRPPPWPRPTRSTWRRRPIAATRTR